jgi:uncharacterized membrane protein
MSEPADEGTETARAGALSLDRLLLFTDGVFAIAITILVLDLNVPDDLSVAELHEQLDDLVPALLAAALSFAVIGRFWISHHTMFVWIRRVDMPLMWLNLLLLAPVVFLPFVTRLLAEYGNVPFVVIAYSATVGAVALANLAIWLYATHDHRLTDRVPDADLIGKTAGLIMVAVAFLLAIVLAPFLGAFALFAYLLSALPADRIWFALRRRSRS